MTSSLAQMIAAAAMLGIAIALVVGFRKYLAANSERRMRSMLATVGLDPELATSGEIPAIMEEMRYRCRQCSSEAVCERWLVGEEEGGNGFCPNHRVFEILNKYTAP